MRGWRQHPINKTEDHKLEVVDNDSEDEPLQWWWHAYVKWDGCIHLHGAGNVPFGPEFEDREKAAACDDYIHICDLDDMIERLQKLKIAAVAHFGEHWPDL